MGIGDRSDERDFGVDVALINTDREDVGRVGPSGYRAYSEAERALLRRAMASAANLASRDDRPAFLAEAETLVNDIHAEAVETFMAANGLPASEIGVIGFHGAGPFCTSRNAASPCSSAMERRWRRGSGFRWSTIFAAPTSRPEVRRAHRAGLPSRHGRSPAAYWPMQCGRWLDEVGYAALGLRSGLRRLSR
jgi:hypothetical protein